MWSIAIHNKHNDHQSVRYFVYEVCFLITKLTFIKEEWLSQSKIPSMGTF